MTLQDLMEFIWDEAERGTLSRNKVDRAMLLAYEMGMEQGRLEGDTATRRERETRGHGDTATRRPDPASLPASPRRPFSASSPPEDTGRERDAAPQEERR